MSVSTIMPHTSQVVGVRSFLSGFTCKREKYRENWVCAKEETAKGGAGKGKNHFLT